MILAQEGWCFDIAQGKERPTFSRAPIAAFFPKKKIGKKILQQRAKPLL